MTSLGDGPKIGVTDVFACSLSDLAPLDLGTQF
jgi:hypothetical protein